MKTLLKQMFVIVSLCSATAVYAQTSLPRDWQWVTGGQTNTDYTWVHAATTDSKDNVYIAGSYKKNITVDSQTYTGPGLRNIFLAKIDSSGHTLWVYNLPCPNSAMAEGEGVVLDKAGNAYISFNFDDWIYPPTGDSIMSHSGLPDIGVAKVDSNGHQVWIKTWGTFEEETISNLAIDSNDHISFTGIYSWEVPGYTIDFGAYSLYGTHAGTQYLTQIDTAGNVLWAKNIADPGKTRYITIRADAQGNLCITGSFTTDSVDFSGIVLTRMPYNSQDIFLAKFNDNGDVQWARSIGSVVPAGGIPGSLLGNDVCFDAAGNVYQVGSEQIPTFDSLVFENGTSISVNSGFLAKYTPSGQLSWVKRVGQEYAGAPLYTLTNPMYLSIDNRQRIYISGEYHTSAVFGPDTIIGPPYGYNDQFIALYDTAGNGRLGEDLKRSYAGPVCATNNGFVYAAGMANMSMTFGTHYFQLTSGKAYFVAKLNVPYEKNETPVTTGISSVSKEKEGIPVIYPNPANSFFRIELPKMDFEQVDLIDVQGKIITSASVLQRNQQINLPPLAAGIYYVRFIGKDKTVTYPLSIAL